MHVCSSCGGCPRGFSVSLVSPATLSILTTEVECDNRLLFHIDSALTLVTALIICMCGLNLKEVIQS